MNHTEYFHSGKVAIKVNNELEHTVLNNLYAVDGVKPRELYNESYPYVMVEDPNNGGLAITSYGAVSPRAKASFDSVLHFLASPVPQFKLNYDDMEICAYYDEANQESRVRLEFPCSVRQVSLNEQDIYNITNLKKSFDNFNDVG